MCYLSQHRVRVFIIATWSSSRSYVVFNHILVFVFTNSLCYCLCAGVQVVWQMRSSSLCSSHSWLWPRKQVSCRHQRYSVCRDSMCRQRLQQVFQSGQLSLDQVGNFVASYMIFVEVCEYLSNEYLMSTFRYLLDEPSSSWARMIGSGKASIGPTWYYRFNWGSDNSRVLISVASTENPFKIHHIKVILGSIKCSL